MTRIVGKLLTDLKLTSEAELLAWLAQSASDQRPYLLAHADDGVIWGRWEAGQWTFSGAPDAFPEVGAALRLFTLQQARVFGPGGRVWVWRAAAGWAGRQIDEATLPEDIDDDHQWVWGTPAQAKDAEGNLTMLPSRNGFTLLEDGAQGLRHAPPMTGLGKEDRVRLLVRHYVAYLNAASTSEPVTADDVLNTGQAYILTSRLLGLEKVVEN